MLQEGCYFCNVLFILTAGDLNASEITMSEDERIQLMILVKEGKLSIHEAVETVGRSYQTIN